MARAKKVTQEDLPVIEIEDLEGGGFNPDRVRFLVYGESGIGKTRFASTWPKPFFIDADDGLASVDLPVSRVAVEDWNQMEVIYEFLAEGEHEFQTIIIDSLNECQAKALKNVVDSYPNIRRAYDSIASQSDYGKMLSDFDDLIRRFKALPYHIILIAQVNEKEFDTDIITPQLIGKSTARNICRMMDVVGYMFREDQEPNMGFSFSDFTSKDRSGTLPATVRNPSYRKLARYWNNKPQSKDRS